jgi:maltose alpha-D-glucosyltransferase/alpha-amylase
MIQMRREHRVFGRGSLEFVDSPNRRVVSYIRRHQDEIALVVNNLSRFAQHDDLKLTAYKGMTPVEMAGNTPFPGIGASPYPISLGPYGFYWFRLEKGPS